MVTGRESHQKMMGRRKMLTMTYEAFLSRLSSNKATIRSIPSFKGFYFLLINKFAGYYCIFR